MTEHDKAGHVVSMNKNGNGNWPRWLTLSGLLLLALNACTTDASLGPRPDAGAPIDGSDSAEADGGAVIEPGTWARAVGGEYGASVHRVGVDTENHVFVAGRAAGRAEFGDGVGSTGAGPFYVASYTLEGGLRWATRLAGSDSSVGRRVDMAVGDAVVVSYVASSLGQLVVSALDRDSGAVRWTVALAASDEDAVAAVAVEPSGRVYAVGNFRGTLRAGAHAVSSVGWSDIFALAIEPNGEPAWLRAFATGSTVRLVEADTLLWDGARLVFTGRFANSIALGTRTLSIDGSGEFVAELDRDGVALGGSVLFEGDAAAEVEGLVSGADGRRYLVGRYRGTLNVGASTVSSTGTFDIFVASFERDGTSRWVRSFGQGMRDGGSAIDWGRALAMGADGTVYVGGAFNRSLQLETATLDGPLGDAQSIMLLLRLDSAGNVLASKVGGVDYSEDMVNAVVPLPDGNVLVGGEMNRPGPVFAGLRAETSLGDNGLGFVARIVF